MTIALSIITLIAGYLIGSIMTAVKIAKSKSKNIRECGSGNAGSTNIMRTFGWKWGLICLFFDSLKGAVSVGVGMALGYIVPAVFKWYHPMVQLPLFLGCVGLLGAVIGHLLPVFYQFRGGKCVAVGLGGLLALAPIQLLIALGIALILIAITRMVSVGSVVGTLVAATLIIVKNFGNIPLMAIAVIIAVVVVVAHLPNIQRIMEGRERHIEKTEWEKRICDDEQKPCENAECENAGK